MSLKAFHLVFIVASILLAVGMAVWSFVNYASAHRLVDLLVGIGSVIVAVALVCYERYFLKKVKECELSMSRLIRCKLIWAVLATVLMLRPDAAFACAACYGNSDSPLAQGMNWGIFSLLAVVGCVLSGVAGVGV